MTRQRRAGANRQDDRIYTEEDYAIPSSAPLPDEWEDPQDAYAAPGWTGEAVIPDEAFAPDSEDCDEGEWAAQGNWGVDNAWEDEEAWEEALPPEKERRFSSFFVEDVDFTEEIDPLSDELLTEEEQQELKRSHWQLISGLADFAGVILGTAAILVLVTLLVSLLNWLINDISQSFILLQKHL